MSAEEPIVVEEIAVRRSVAGELEGVKVEKLSPGINVVFGPNASGKSTLAQLLQTLLWPDAAGDDGVSVTGTIRVGDSSWRVDVDGRRVVRRVEEGGGDPPVPSASTRDRYQLCLQDLLESDGASFAQFILRESVGGFDVEEAARVLEYEKPALRVRKATRKVEGAHREWEEARREQHNLRQRQEGLADWEEKLRETERAKRRELAVRKAIELREIDDEMMALKARVATFPDAMEHLRGDELELLDEVRQSVEAAQGEFDDAEQRIRGVEEVLNENRLVARWSRSEIASGERIGESFRELSQELRDELEAAGDYAGRLGEVERRIEDVRRELGEQRRRYERSWRRIGGVYEAGDAPQLDGDALDEMFSLARRAQGLASRRAAREELATLVGDAEVPQDLEELRRGIGLLRSWLNSPVEQGQKTGGGALRFVALTITAGLAILAVVAAMAVHPAALFLLFFAAGTAWIFWSARSETTGSDRRKVYRRDFERMALDPPATWSEQAVEEHLRELVEQWARGSLEAEKARWWRERAADQSLKEAQRAVDDRRRAIEEEYGIAVDEDGATTYVLAEQIHRWQVAGDDVAALEARLEALEEQKEELCAKLDRVMEPLGFKAVDDAARATAKLAAIEEAMRSLEVQKERLRIAKRDGVTAKRKMARSEKRRSDLFERLRVDDVSSVEAICAQRDSYEELIDEIRLKQRQAAAMKAELLSTEEFSEEFLSRSADELGRMAEALNEKARRRDDILRKIQAIRTEVEAAKASVDLERKWARYRALRDGLRRRRRIDMGRAVGAVIADYIGETSRESSRPKVFRRARELFAVITRGRYRLDLIDEYASPRFVAFDERHHVERQLHELSSGTRVQLLVAVRVAFVECVERGAKAPLVLDEALANSDDERARAIAEAVERVAAAGRQVFYFTAQSDEVRTWEQLIEQSDVKGKVVDLGELTETSRGGDWRERFDGQVAVPQHLGVPDPGEMSHEEYGRVLGVDNGVSPRTPVGDLHLWFLVEEVNSLHKLLSEGLSSWGQLQNLARYGGLAAVGMSRGEYTKVATRVRALEALMEAWKVGRGRPVDRRTLERSGAVSETFIDEVDELCLEVDGDAQKLLEALERGEVRRFRSAKIDELREFLEERGYLDEEEPLSSDEVWIRVKAAVSEQLAEGAIQDDDLRRVLWRAAARKSGGEQMAMGGERA